MTLDELDKRLREFVAVWCEDKKREPDLRLVSDMAYALGIEMRFGDAKPIAKGGQHEG